MGDELGLYNPLILNSWDIQVGDLEKKRFVFWSVDWLSLNLTTQSGNRD